MGKVSDRLEIWADNTTLALEDFAQKRRVKNVFGASFINTATDILLFPPYVELHARYLFGRDKSSGNTPDAH